MNKHIIDGNQGIQPNQQETGKAAQQQEGGGQAPPLALLQAALDYAQDGWAVFPLHRRLLRRSGYEGRERRSLNQ